MPVGARRIRLPRRLPGHKTTFAPSLPAQPQARAQTAPCGPEAALPLYYRQVRIRNGCPHGVMSSRTRSVAVAVRAIIGTAGKSCLSCCRLR